MTRKAGGGGTIILRAGTHYLQTQLNLDAGDSNLAFQAFPGEEVWLSRGTPLAKIKWVLVSNSSGNSSWTEQDGQNAVFGSPSGTFFNSTQESWQACEAMCNADRLAGPLFLFCIVPSVRFLCQHVFAPSVNLSYTPLVTFIPTSSQCALSPERCRWPLHYFYVARSFMLGLREAMLVQNGRVVQVFYPLSQDGWNSPGKKISHNLPASVPRQRLGTSVAITQLHLKRIYTQLT